MNGRSILLIIILSVGGFIYDQPCEASVDGNPTSTTAQWNDRPNFIVILTDDQDSLLGSPEAMPHLKRHFADKGTEMQRAFVTTPVCCPSRSSMLTGQYVHNHHVFTNKENCTSEMWRQRHEPATFGKQLNDAGYQTAYMGKYLNRYDGTYIPPGWDRWLGQVKNTKFYNYSVNEDGQLRWHGANYSEDYFTDVVTNRSLAILRDWADVEAGKRRPFLLVISYPAPHGPEDAAPQHQSLFANNLRHRTASYNWAPSPDKEWLLRRAESLSPLHKRFTDTLQRKRLQTLQSVDNGLLRLASWLDDESPEEISGNTFVFYTSDHGYHLGQFGLLKGKSTPYEFDIRVPLVVRGPGVAAGRVNRQPVLNIDLAPTLLDLAGVAPARQMDGASYAPLLQPATKPETNSSVQWRRSFLIERGRMTVRKMSLRRELEAVRNFGQDKRLCSQRDMRSSLSCSHGDRFHCVPSGSQTGQHERVRCPSARGSIGVSSAGRCRCRRSVMLPISEYVWKHCWRLRRRRLGRRSRSPRSSSSSKPDSRAEEEDGEEDFGEQHDDDGDDEDDIQCEYSSLSDWLRDRRMMRLTQRRLDDIQTKLHRMRLAMRRNKAVLMRLRGGCNCPGDSLRVSVNKLPNLWGRRRLVDLLPRRRAGRRRRRRKRGECNLRFMSCFFHDKSHWKTPPYWNDSSICFCGNANNYTYWCLRSVNGPEESLYCEFVTGFISYYNITEDPHQLTNRVAQLSFERRAELHAALNLLRSCSGVSCLAAGL